VRVLDNQIYPHYRDCVMRLRFLQKFSTPLCCFSRSALNLAAILIWIAADAYTDSVIASLPPVCTTCLFSTTYCLSAHLYVCLYLSLLVICLALSFVLSPKLACSK
jgi:hypothetical protein